MSEQLPEIITTWLDGVRPEHRDLFTQLHRLLMSAEPDFTIALKWSNPAYTVRGQTFAYLADQADNVQLGFYNGAQFDDAHGVVEGTGKRLRHVKVSSIDADVKRKLTETITASLAVGSAYQA